MTNSIHTTTPFCLDFSLGDRLQVYVIQLSVHSQYPVLGPVGARLIAVPGMLVARIMDMAIHLFMGFVKLFVGAILLPVHLVMHVVHHKEWNTEWTMRRGCLHIGKAILFGVDALAAPCVNLINPDLNGQTWRFRAKEQEFERLKLETKQQVEEISRLAPTIKGVMHKWHKAQSDLKQAYNEIAILQQQNQQLQDNTNQLSKKIFELTKECLELKTEL